MWVWRYLRPMKWGLKERARHTLPGSYSGDWWGASDLDFQLLYGTTQRGSSRESLNFIPASSKNLFNSSVQSPAPDSTAMSQWGWPPPPHLNQFGSFTRLPAFNYRKPDYRWSYTVSIGCWHWSVWHAKEQVFLCIFMSCKRCSTICRHWAGRTE